LFWGQLKEDAFLTLHLASHLTQYNFGLKKGISLADVDILQQEEKHI
jgi:hypothetical protein